MRRLEAWAERRARQAVERTKSRLVRSVDVPGVTATTTDAGVELSGRRLGLRLLTESRLSWIGGLFR